MSALLNPAQQRSLQTVLHDLTQLGHDVLAGGLNLVVTTHPLPASDRFTATVSTARGLVAETFVGRRS